MNVQISFNPSNTVWFKLTEAGREHLKAFWRKRNKSLTEKGAEELLAPHISHDGYTEFSLRETLEIFGINFTGDGTSDGGPCLIEHQTLHLIRPIK